MRIYMRVYEVTCEYESYGFFTSVQRARRFIREELLLELFNITPDSEESNKVMTEIEQEYYCDKYGILISCFNVNTEEE